MKNFLAVFQSKFNFLNKQKYASLWVAKYAVIFIFFIFFFMPIKERGTSYSSNEKSLKREIGDIEKISEGFLNPKEIETLQERQERFENKLTDAGHAASLIHEISQEAEKNHLNIIQIYSDSPIAIKKDDGTDLELRGIKLSLLPVSFRMDVDYKNLASFFNSLLQNSKAIFVVESMHIQKVSPDAQTLQCDVTLSYISK